VVDFWDLRWDGAEVFIARNTWVVQVLGAELAWMDRRSTGGAIVFQDSAAFAHARMLGTGTLIN
jgi:hypothetical protein